VRRLFQKRLLLLKISLWPGQRLKSLFFLHILLKYSKHIGEFQEEGITLVPFFAETAGAALVSQLKRTKGGLEPVYEYRLDIFFIDDRIALEKNLDE
jgi:hypothetical protein